MARDGPRALRRRGSGELPVLHCGRSEPQRLRARHMGGRRQAGTLRDRQLHLACLRRSPRLQASERPSRGRLVLLRARCRQERRQASELRLGGRPHTHKHLHCRRAVQELVRDGSSQHDLRLPRQRCCREPHQPLALECLALLATGAHCQERSELRRRGRREPQDHLQRWQQVPRHLSLRPLRVLQSAGRGRHGTDHGPALQGGHDYRGRQLVCAAQLGRKG